jgi:superfamily I DNA and RNA helicase
VSATRPYRNIAGDHLTQNLHHAQGQHLPSIAQALARTLNHWRQYASMSPAEVRSIIDALAPTVSVRRTLADAAHDADAGLLQVTNDQIRAFAMTRKTPRAVVFGGAGTGKTVLACEKARQLTDEGNTVLLTCFNEFLARRLSADKSLEHVTIATFHSLCISTARSAGLEVPTSPESKWRISDAPILLMEGAEATGLNFDAVVVDEGQDFSRLC